LKFICGQGWQQEGDLVYLLGSQAVTSLGGSEYLAAIYNKVTGRPAPVDLELEKRVQGACRHGIRQGWVRSAHDCSEGGLAVALAEACLSGGRGASVSLAPGSLRWDQALFGEGSSRILVSVDPAQRSPWEAYLESQLPGQWQLLGQVGGPADPLVLTTAEGDPLLSVSLAALQGAYYSAFAD